MTISVGRKRDNGVETTLLYDSCPHCIIPQNIAVVVDVDYVGKQQLKNLSSATAPAAPHSTPAMINWKFDLLEIC